MPTFISNISFGAFNVLLICLLIYICFYFGSFTLLHYRINVFCVKTEFQTQVLLLEIYEIKNKYVTCLYLSVKTPGLTCVLRILRSADDLLRPSSCSMLCSIAAG